MIFCQGKKEDALPKQPKARQYILTPSRSFGYDPITFAINRSQLLIYGKQQELSLSKTLKMSFMPKQLAH